jgi:hypothetical protein
MVSYMEFSQNGTRMRVPFFFLFVKERFPFGSLNRQTEAEKPIIRLPAVQYYPGSYSAEP